MSKETLTSADLIKRSEELRRQAEEMMRKETPEVIARIKEAIAHYGLTASDLGLSGGAARAETAARRLRRRPPSAPVHAQQGKPRRSAAVSYRDDQGHSWSGFGPKPKWLKDALASGVSEESLRA